MSVHPVKAGLRVLTTAGALRVVYGSCSEQCKGRTEFDQAAGMYVPLNEAWIIGVCCTWMIKKIRTLVMARRNA